MVTTPGTACSLAGERAYASARSVITGTKAVGAAALIERASAAASTSTRPATAAAVPAASVGAAGFDTRR